MPAAYFDEEWPVSDEEYVLSPEKTIDEQTEKLLELLKPHHTEGAVHSSKFCKNLGWAKIKSLKPCRDKK